jgi:hypothetical protein
MGSSVRVDLHRHRSVGPGVGRATVPRVPALPGRSAWPWGRPTEGSSWLSMTPPRLAARTARPWVRTGVPLRDVHLAGRDADPRAGVACDRRRQNFGARLPRHRRLRDRRPTRPPEPSHGHRPLRPAVGTARRPPGRGRGCLGGRLMPLRAASVRPSRTSTAHHVPGGG